MEIIKTSDYGNQMMMVADADSIMRRGEAAAECNDVDDSSNGGGGVFHQKRPIFV